MLHSALLVIAFILGCALPFSLLIGREKIRAKRYEIIADLESILFKTPAGAANIPSFELVKYKYRPITKMQRSNGVVRNLLFLIPTGIYSVVSSFGLVLTALFLLEKFTALTPGKQNYESTPYLLMFTFMGGYIWSLQYLIRKVANFDLSPISFYRSALHILIGLVVCAALSASGLLAFISRATGLDGAAVAIALLVGFVPSVFIEYLTEYFPRLRLKRVSDSSKALQDELPLDLIYGIDPFIKFRLAEFEIEDVQNLATTNPIQIFVETPYGLYEIIDWVSQAQLILAVGSAKTLLLRKYNIRTVFDLKKMSKDPELSKALLLILISTDETDFSSSTGSELKGEHASMVEALVEIILDDLHVRRLQQIWKIIDNAIESANVPTVFCKCGGKISNVQGVGSANEEGNGPLADEHEKTPA
ncbi:hypothetical protein [Pseudomonas fluorescens]|uniref:Uncharacterized protein n=1 Tax=Pseudomonas fluorescens TaxID=294 RepID=A0A423MBJ6_PSEFL|nr:hypothetical protein [Pseudomonas fluorescens]RON80641.1 hypothetical protein BK670_10565 [Pseudomonas fluorescens]